MDTRLPTAAQQAGEVLRKAYPCFLSGARVLGCAGRTSGEKQAETLGVDVLIYKLPALLCSVGL